MQGKLFCEHRTINDLNSELVGMLKILEERLKQTFGVNFELTINCGVRCPECNKAVGGASHSKHLSVMEGDIADAVDIHCEDSFLRYMILKSAVLLNFTGIEWGTPTWIHLDIGRDKPCCFLPNPK